MWSDLANSVAGIVTGSVNGDWGLLASSIVETVGSGLDVISSLDFSFLGSGATEPAASTVVETVSEVAETTAAVAA
ncbi:MAG: beta-class phenol-soluble modulin [Corynebacterium sp.]|nr:beta-class phenol-soluble modulin [Corynebacterium sp.]